MDVDKGSEGTATPVVGIKTNNGKAIIVMETGEKVVLEISETTDDVVQEDELVFDFFLFC